MNLTLVSPQSAHWRLFVWLRGFLREGVSLVSIVLETMEQFSNDLVNLVRWLGILGLFIILYMLSTLNILLIFKLIGNWLENLYDIFCILNSIS